MSRYTRGPRTVHRNPASITEPAPEAAFTRQVLEVADWHRWPLKYHIARSDRAAATSLGFPDWILARPGRVVALELKSRVGKPTPQQLAWVAAMDGSRIDAMVAWPKDLEVIQGLLVP